MKGPTSPIVAGEAHCGRPPVTMGQRQTAVAVVFKSASHFSKRIVGSVEGIKGMEVLVNRGPVRMGSVLFKGLLVPLEVL